ncbi:hypothetical protein T265_02408 [Opisthorchis viverrini]|uniref:Uncharacterized protein n=1 Tax=Opisthorchis viverrini TaxID=6198 RepID=A0A075AIB8_OPIVI|nr:hypothetical protein T265_02408 [Opisthorchis viverrini]KER31359.1 hypothetical protein T265_02408 [Opisthorchis viverrini]
MTRSFVWVDFNLENGTELRDIEPGLHAMSFSCSTLSVPNCHATLRKHECWDTARLPKPRQGKSTGRGWVRAKGLPVSKFATQPFDLEDARSFASTIKTQRFLGDIDIPNINAQHGVRNTSTALHICSVGGSNFLEVLTRSGCSIGNRHSANTGSRPDAGPTSVPNFRPVLRGMNFSAVAAPECERSRGIRADFRPTVLYSVILCLSHFNISTNDTKRLHKLRNRSHFSRDAKRSYEKTYYSRASPISSVTVTLVVRVAVDRFAALDH